MALQSFNTSCDRKFRKKKKSPHPKPAALSSRVPGGRTEATERSQGLEGDPWAALLGRAFSSSGVFPWVAARKAPEFIKNPKPRAQLVVFTTRPWIPPSRRGPSLAGAALHGTHPAGTRQTLLRTRRREEVLGGQKAASPGHGEGEGTGAPGAAGGSAGAAVGSPWAGSPWAGMRSRKDRFGRE